ncbi:MAG: NAD(P)-dependent alcohol dehydrogenase [Rhodospirillaceae bacterium]|mgnify:CR=1 FL=1|nr:NAD(P)-dependent alcohol dehydrogenase [Rhodospirillaceae bacterium]
MTTSSLPATMRVIEFTGLGLDAIRAVEQPVPAPGPGEILIRVKAVSLNYRDLAITQGKYRPDVQFPYIPASDAAGEVVAVGQGVTRFRVGDRAVPTYIQGWHDGMPTAQQRREQSLGVPLPGVLRDYVAVPAEDAVHTPESLTDAEASTLPIAAVTAWYALMDGGIKAGDWVLIEGTGGVAIFALQFAKIMGARVVVLSSSNDKLARAEKLGADVGINYREIPDWSQAVRDATGGHGVDIVVETGGATLPMAVAATAFGGYIGLVGFVAGMEATVKIPTLIGPMIRIGSIAVGPRAAFEAANRAIEAHGLKPVIDRTFGFGEVREAFDLMQKGGHFGKIVITL